MTPMAGFPEGLFWGTAAALPLLSLLMVAFLQTRGFAPSTNYRRWDLLQIPFVKALLKKRPFQFWVQLPFVLTFLLIIVAGFGGTQVSYLNLAPILTWTVWWAGLIFAVLFLGKVWCLVCPWNALAQWLQRWTLWGKKESSLSLNLRWPRRLRNIYPALLLFVGLTWLELGFGVTRSPWATAALGVLILLLALLPALYFERKPFCRYACLVGQISGLYALFGTLELRSRDKSLCRSCRTQDCVRGNDKGYGCPVYEYPATMDQSTYCILCMECIKTCPHDNISLNFRPFARDLAQGRRLRADETAMVLGIVALTSFHGITMTPLWSTLIEGLRAIAPPGDLGIVIAFSLGMGLILVVPAFFYAVFAGISHWLRPVATIAFHKVFLAYAFALLPVALFYHLAHNAHHLFTEGQRVLPVLSDPLGWGWNLLGTASWEVGPILGMAPLQFVQAFLILAGQAGAVYVAFAVSRHLFPDRPTALRSLFVIVASTVLFSFANLWLLSLPMQMRTAM